MRSKQIVSKRCEEYLEIIYCMVKRGEKPRVNRIARELGVKPSSVVEFLRKLREKGFIVYEAGGEIHLTEKGLDLAKSVFNRHQAIKRFLVSIGVSEEIAEKDACYIEHGIHEETLRKLIEFVNKTLGGFEH